MELEHRFNLICNIFFFLRSLKEEILERIFRISLTHNNKFPIILAIIFERVDFFGIEALSNIPSSGKNWNIHSSISTNQLLLTTIWYYNSNHALKNVNFIHVFAFGKFDAVAFLKLQNGKNACRVLAGIRVRLISVQL